MFKINFLVHFSQLVQLMMGLTFNHLTKIDMTELL